MSDTIKFKQKLYCPFCGTEMEIVGEYLGQQALLHPSERECWARGNLFYHQDLYRLWAQRKEPEVTE